MSDCLVGELDLDSEGKHAHISHDDGPFFFWNSLGLDDGIGNENPFHRGCQIQNHQQPFGRYLNNWENSPSVLYFLPILQFVGGFSTMPLLNPHIRWKYTSPLVFNEFNVPILIGSNIANLASFNEQFELICTNT